MDTRVLDHTHGYGLVSRFFHWAMALLLLWQIVSAALHYLWDETPITEFFFGYHYSNGVLILLLAVLRGIWGLINLSRRPSRRGGLQRAAVACHVAMYALLIAVPVIAIIRAYGCTKPFSTLGIEIFSGMDTKVEWMRDLGNE